MLNTLYRFIETLKGINISFFVGDLANDIINHLSNKPEFQGENGEYLQQLIQNPCIKGCRISDTFEKQ